MGWETFQFAECKNTQKNRPTRFNSKFYCFRSTYIFFRSLNDESELKHHLVLKQSSNLKPHASLLTLAKQDYEICLAYNKVAMDDITLNIVAPVKKAKVVKTASTVYAKKTSVASKPTVKSAESKVKHHKRSDNKSGDEIKSSRISSLFSKETEPVASVNFDIIPVEETLFSTNTFAGSGYIHPHLVGNLHQLFQIDQLTVVQQLTIPVLLSGKDALVRSQTGSGKTLAYALPMMQKLQEAIPKVTRQDGIKALVVLPTRELALQTYECFLKLNRAFTWIVPGLLVGGEKRKSEKARLRKGINVLIGTPGRLLDHADYTESFALHKIDWLILDEADKLLDMGYEKDIARLVTIINEQRDKAINNIGRKQTVLLSATLGPGVERLAGLTLVNPERVDASEEDNCEEALVIPKSLEQKYVVTPAKLRLVTLASFIIQQCDMTNKKKVLIFLATQDMVDYYTELIPTVITSNVPFFKLHGNMAQSDRTEVFKAFRSSKTGVLLCTDVGARGLDLPLVDWIVQFTAPSSPAEYVHRVGRTARVGTAGSSLLFLIPSELQFLQWLQEKRLKLEEVNMETYLNCLMKIHLESKDGQNWGGGVEGAATVLQHNFEHAVLEQKQLHDLACKAYKSYIRFYASYPKEARAVFSFKSIHLGHHAKCFALRDPPSSIGGIGKPAYKNQQRRFPGKEKKKQGLGLETDSSRTKRLIISEFDSGLSKKRKKK